MKKIILLSALLIFTATFAQTVNAAINQETKKEAGYISLNETVTKEIEPDTATISFAVENTADTAQKASLDNNAVSNNIINALKSIVDANTDTIKTTDFSVRPVYATSVGGKRTIKNYTAVNSVTVTTKDIKKVVKLIDAAIASGANRTNNLYFGVENSKQICNETAPQIVKELKSRAAILAAAADSSLDGLKNLNISCNTDSVVSNGRFLMAKSAGDMVEEAAAEPAIEAGKTKIRIYVNADFYVK